MKKLGFPEALQQILKEDARFDEHAYLFIREALDFTIKLFSKPVEGAGRHVSGAELLEGIRQFSLKEFGPMAKTVLNNWGIKKCEDFGEIVFNLVDKGVLGKTEQDKKEDFAGGYDFDEAFRQPFKTPKKSGTSRSSAQKKAK
jgi:uncharacterized repeat protein (TIGR04138 family)